MEYEVFASLVSNIGFPIACVAAMFWQLNKERESHQDEVAKMTDALNNNTVAVTKLCDKIGGD